MTKMIVSVNDQDDVSKHCLTELIMMIMVKCNELKGFTMLLPEMFSLLPVKTEELLVCHLKEN